MSIWPCTTETFLPTNTRKAPGQHQGQQLFHLSVFHVLPVPFSNHIKNAKGRLSLPPAPAERRSTLFVFDIPKRGDFLQRQPLLLACLLARDYSEPSRLSTPQAKLFFNYYINFLKTQEETLNLSYGFGGRLPPKTGKPSRFPRTALPSFISCQRTG